MRLVSMLSPFCSLNSSDVNNRYYRKYHAYRIFTWIEIIQMLNSKKADVVFRGYRPAGMVPRYTTALIHRILIC